MSPFLYLSWHLNVKHKEIVTDFDVINNLITLKLKYIAVLLKDIYRYNPIS